MTIHTFGDSHSVDGWRNISSPHYNISSHHLNSMLCYSFGKEKLNRIDIRNFNINDGDTIIFCLGEIDCRCHIHKHVNDTTTYQSIIESIVEDYFEAIKLNVEVLNVNLKNICVYNVVPPIEKHNTLENPEYPYLGSDEERKQYALYFNEKLKEKCIENQYIFFDIYNYYTDNNGFLRKDMSDGNVHIRNSMYISKFIEEHLL